MPTRRGAAALLAPPARNPDQAAERAVATFRVIGSPGYPLDEDWLRAYARRAFARGLAAGADAGSPRRQLAAAMASPSRLPGLRGLRVPTLVVHGEDDPLIRPAAGRATARAVPGCPAAHLPRDGPQPARRALARARGGGARVRGPRRASALDPAGRRASARQRLSGVPGRTHA